MKPSPCFMENHNMRHLVLDCREPLNRLHTRLAAALSFPDWYGHNLDALYDCLTDLREPVCLWLRHPEAAPGLRRVLTDCARENPAVELHIAPQFIMNLTTCDEDLLRYSDRSDLKDFFGSFGLDGLEVLEAGVDARRLIDPADVRGVHLRYYSAWMDFWQGDEARLLAEFSSRENWERTFGGPDRTALTEAYRANLRFANTLRPDYLVFHVSDCSMEESMRRRYHYTPAQICDGAAQLLNQVTGEIEGQPWLLLENLWYPGLTMEDPEVTRRLLDSVDYPKTGVMLDLGHLVHTNMELETVDQAVDYLHRVLDRYEDLSFVKGIHLHLSLSGAYARELTQTWQPQDGTYSERLWAVMTHIFQIDTHRPFLSHRVWELLRRLPALEFLCLEQISGTREEHAGTLQAQMAALLEDEGS